MAACLDWGKSTAGRSAVAVTVFEESAIDGSAK
jgi:hypothetical protein